MFLLSIVRCFTDESWLPGNVIFSSKAAPSNFVREHLKDIEFRYDPFSVGFSFPTHLLANPPKSPLHSGIYSQNQPQTDGSEILERINSTNGFNHSVKGLMKAYIHDAPLRIDTFADALGFSARTLQRKLKQHDVTYAGLADELRFERSHVLLENKQLKIADIARELGYSDSSHFIRAFKRISSLTPEQYRQTHCSKTN